MKKKLLTIILATTMALSFTGCAGSPSEKNVSAAPEEQSTPASPESPEERTEPENPEEDKVYANGETWSVDGLFSVTFTAATPTDERNEFSEKTPAQVVVLNYDYENTGLNDDLYIGNFKVMDANGEMADTYPSGVTSYPQATPKGAKCVGAQDSYGLNNTSDKISVIVSVYDNDYNEHSAKFELTIQ